MLLSEFTPQYLRLEERGDAVVVGVEVQYLTEDMNLERFGHELFALVEQFGCRKLVVSMPHVKMVTSGGLGKMITAHRKMHRHEGTIIFCDLHPTVLGVLETSRLITYLVVETDIETALAALPRE
ncbi:MAG: anti-sigma factor antagonist [Planctomycetaceae bacterium]|nr:anti-sigma factor antagonist [Planctomycetaceae bacterium]